MTDFERIKNFDLESMAIFITTLIVETEERILGQLDALGIDVSLCSTCFDSRVAQQIDLLCREVERDGDT